MAHTPGPPKLVREFILAHGYHFVCSPKEHKIGTILSPGNKINSVSEGRFCYGVPAIVIGIATLQEWYAEADWKGIPRLLPEYPFLYKVSFD